MRQIIDGIQKEVVILDSSSTVISNNQVQDSSGNWLNVGYAPGDLSVPVDITNPVTVNGTVTVVQPTGSNLHVVLDTSNVNVVNFPAEQNVNLNEIGGVTVSPSLYDASNNSIQVSVVSGTITTGPSETQVQDSSGVWQNVGYAPGDLNMPIQGTVSVSGTVTVHPDSSNVNVVNPITVVQPVGSNLHVVLDTSNVNVVNFPAEQNVNLNEIAGVTISPSLYDTSANAI